MQVPDHYLCASNSQGGCSLVVATDQGADRKTALQKQVCDCPPDSTELTGGPCDENRLATIDVHDDAPFAVIGKQNGLPPRCEQAKG
jgi:hypothetical protein